jgi:dTDP-4-dehydrorhamnose 3,5-epimerase
VRFLETELPGVILITPDAHQDSRGVFFELYHAQNYLRGGIREPFVQDNFSRSARGVLRGLHYQLKQPQGKLVTVLEGTVFDVAVDIRKGSPTFGKWTSLELSAENKLQLYIPPGFAHGFCAMTESAGMLYKCTQLYAPSDERGIIWNDPALAIPWPIHAPLLSPKDRSFKVLSEMSGELPEYSPHS